MAFEIVHTEQFENDLIFLIEYYRQYGDLTAKKYFEKIIEATDRLEQFPDSGRKIPEFESIESEYREIIFEHFRIIYFFKNKIVYLIKILNQKQLLERI